MTSEILPIAAAGWAFITLLFSGSLGLALIVFVLLKILGR